MPRSMTWPEVWRRRLERHSLLQPAPPERLVDIVGEVCGIHAQVAASAELSLGLRVRGITRSDINAALWQERTLVRTYGLRGTLHVFPAHELGLWIAALQAKVPPREPARPELPPAKREALVQAIVDALSGHQLTNAELGEAVEQRLGAWATERVHPAFGQQWPRWQLALRDVCMQGLVVAGPPLGTRVTYVRTCDWIGPLARVDGKSALREVCRRFLDAYGPATHVEFARWFYTRPSAARELMASLELEQVEVEGWRAWLPRETSANPSPSREAPRNTDEAVTLLPQFDCYVVGGFPRNRLIPPEAPAELQRGTAAPFSVVLVDGVVAGLWERRRRGSQLEIRIHTFAELSAGLRTQAERQAERVAAILQLRPVVGFGPVEPRAHL